MIKNGLILVFIMLFVSCTQDHNQQEVKTQNETAVSKDNNIPSVEVMQPLLLSFDGEILITGTAAPNKTVRVHAMESGIIEWIKYDIGDFVRQGQIIARMSNPEISRNILETEMAISYKKRMYDRLKSIFETTPDLTNINVLDQAEEAYQNLVARLNSLKNRSAYLDIKAPFSGIITKRFLDKGTMVQNALSQPLADPIVEMMDISTIRLEVHLPETDVRYVQRGTEVSVVFPELGKDVINVQVTRMSGALDEMSKTLLMEIDIANPKGEIKPGMFAEVTIELKNASKVLSLPHMSSVIQKNALNVYVVRDGVAYLTPIKKGLENTEYFQVLSGISADDLVVISGKSSVHDALKVQAVQK